MAGIEIIRDVDGIAHVRADTLAGAFEGQGVAATQDRLWQMELDRRRAMGRLSEVVGPTGVASDTFHRRMGLQDSAQRSLAVLGAETVEALGAYARGVNRHIDAVVAGRATAPPEFELLGLEPEAWQPWHSIALFQVRHLAMGTYEAKLWRSGLVRHLDPTGVARLWPSQPEQTIDPTEDVIAVAIRAAEAMGSARTALGVVGETPASNNLAIAPERTATGAPLLAGDPHRAIDLPNVYWQNHLSCPEVDVIGLSFPGVPGFPHFGHNADVAWCITHGMADDQDVYVETLRDRQDPGVDGVEYRHDGGWRPADVREETITVAGGTPVTVRCVVTHHGPVVAGDDQVGLSLAWTALAAPDTTFDALVPMLRASSVDDLDRAFEPWVVPVNNVLMADRAGTIAYRMRGRLAVRGADNGWTAVPGDDPAHDWTGLVDDGDLPRWRDPDTAFLVTANNRISGGGPYVSHDFAHPARATRLTARLIERSDWDVASVTALLGDTHSSVSATLAGRLLTVDVGQPLEARAQRVLAGWNAHMDADSAAAAVCGATRAELLALVIAEHGLADDRLAGVAGPSLHQTMRFLNARLATWLADPDLVPDRLVATALRLAVRSLELTQGPDPTTWRWGRAHTARFVHPLAALRPDLADVLAVPPAVELGGDNESVWATSTAPPSTEACNGPVARYVFDLGDWDRSVWIVPHGVSGDPTSPHHLDQLDRWTNVAMAPMRYSPAVVDLATLSTTLLSSDREL